jgi:hypothetical protein
VHQPCLFTNSGLQAREAALPRSHLQLYEQTAPSLQISCQLSSIMPMLSVMGAERVWFLLRPKDIATKDYPGVEYCTQFVRDASIFSIQNVSLHMSFSLGG